MMARANPTNTEERLARLERAVAQLAHTQLLPGAAAPMARSKRHPDLAVLIEEYERELAEQGLTARPGFSGSGVS
jgi:hypothetical protein